MSAAAPLPGSTPSPATPAASAPGSATPGPVLVPPAAGAPAAPSDPTKSAAPDPAQPNQPGAPAEPAAYEPFKLPEGFALADEDAATVTALGRELGADQAKAQKLVDAAAAFGQRLLAQAEEQRAAAATKEQGEWSAAIDADPQLGGDAWPKTVELLDRARAAFPTLQKAAELLAERGLAGHPDLIRAWRDIGLALREDSPPPGDPGTAPAAKDTAALMYPNEAKARS